MTQTPYNFPYGLEKRRKAQPNSKCYQSPRSDYAEVSLGDDEIVIRRRNSLSCARRPAKHFPSREKDDCSWDC